MLNAAQQRMNQDRVVADENKISANPKEFALTRVSVRGLREKKYSKLIDDFEFDALDPQLESSTVRRKMLRSFLPHQNLALTFGHFFLRGEDSVDLREKARSAAERCALFGAKSSSILVPPSFERVHSLLESLNYFREDFKRLGLAAPRVDAPFAGDLPLERVGDPLWEKSKQEFLTKEWRIHGYHQTRWIRLYSSETLQGLAQAAIEYKPERILFAHSQRYVQAFDLICRINKLKGAI